MLLPDINVWLALTFQSHFHHLAAKAWFDSLTTELCLFCRFTQLGFLRLASNQSVFGASTVTMADAWLKYDTYLSDSRISFVEEPPVIEVQWRDFSQRQTSSPKIWNDAYLAAFAVIGKMELVTFDKGFRHYSKLKCNLLS